MADLKLIKQLRESTGCGIADCNKALAECNFDYEKAVDWLRKKGLSSAAKKSARATTEGLVGISVDNKDSVMVEVNSETDFVARNEQFQRLVSLITKAGLKLVSNDDFVEKVKEVEVDGKKVGDELTDKIAVIGENLQIRRGIKITLNGNGVIASYIHNSVADNLGKIGVLVALKSEANKDKLLELGKQLAMHIAAAKPEFLSETQIPSERVNREKEIFVEQSKASGKPDNIIEKMVEGRLRKFYEEVCLLSQAFVMDDKMKISDILKTFEKENGASVEIQNFALYILGEGLEKKENDFASEVASMTK